MAQPNLQFWDPDIETQFLNTEIAPFLQFLDEHVYGSICVFCFHTKTQYEHHSLTFLFGKSFSISRKIIFFTEFLLDHKNETLHIVYKILPSSTPTSTLTSTELSIALISVFFSPTHTTSS